MDRLQTDCSAGRDASGHWVGSILGSVGRSETLLEGLVVGEVRIEDLPRLPVDDGGGAAEEPAWYGPVLCARVFPGRSGERRESDLFSLGVIAYQMLPGRLPYEAEVAKSRTRAEQRRLTYRSVLDDNREIPAWLDEVLRKATHPDPNKRYEELSEFVYDLRHPSNAYLKKTKQPLIERYPVGFWRTTTILLALVVIVLLISRELG